MILLNMRDVCHLLELDSRISNVLGRGYIGLGIMCEYNHILDIVCLCRNPQLHAAKPRTKRGASKSSILPFHFPPCITVSRLVTSGV